MQLRYFLLLHAHISAAVAVLSDSLPIQVVMLILSLVGLVLGIFAPSDES